MAGILPSLLVDIVIRFTADIPDLPLHITYPETTVTLSLKQLIRQQLPPSLAANRLRLIYAGQVLGDTTPIATSLKLPKQPKSFYSTSKNGGSSHKGKGKEPVRDTPLDSGTTTPTSSRRIYIHCSIGDVLSHAELEAEVTAAEAAETALNKTEPSSPTADRTAPTPPISRQESTTTTAAPRGFDRLLTAGFTPTEVASLRSQFLTNISFSHTPDTMPSGSELRALEDRWLDSGANDAGATMAGQGDTDGWGATFGEGGGDLDDLLWGNVMGFLWPLGALCWGWREEGVWSTRMKIAVLSGIVINMFFGVARYIH